MVSVCKSDGDHDKVDYTERNYKNLVELLEEENALDEETIRNLKEFNQLRNSMSHNFYGAKQRTSHKTELENKFEIGVLFTVRLPVDELKFLYDQARAGNKFAKKLAKVMEDEAEKELEDKYGDKLL